MAVSAAEHEQRGEVELGDDVQACLQQPLAVPAAVAVAVAVAVAHRWHEVGQGESGATPAKSE